ncbi:hypothetical protein FD723_40045 (plasmid) [Nostoc sp. C052]|uniref:hypothetical protein n=1 Tax=Nostoc sp. C052 TaxID=2576902 RepID=UPI0015C34546|nr:hypothetical protein [Nostoc sp. C052]QLE46406.1 hypothetical protein FD723_40045 [Nostoc sp. C052]
MVYKQLVVPDKYWRENKILNGEFLIAQRGTTFNFAPSLTGGAYTIACFDRFTFGTHIASSLDLGTGEKFPQVRLTQESFVQGSGDIPPGNPEKYLRLYFLDAGAAPSPNSFMILNSALDDPRSLLGQTVTVSFYARTSIANRRIGFRLHTADSSVNNHKQIFNKTVTTDGSKKWNKFAVTFKIPSFLEDYNLINIIFFQFMFQCGSNVSKLWTTSATSITPGETIDIADLKLEIGDRATPMPRESYWQQLLKCQQYYWEAPDRTILHGFSTANGSSGIVFATVKFPVPMKKIPGISISSQIYVHLPGIEIGNKNFGGLWLLTPELCEFGILTTYPFPAAAIVEINKNSGQHFKADVGY